MARNARAIFFPPKEGNVNKFLGLPLFAVLFAIPPADVRASSLVEGIRSSTSVEYSDGVSARIECRGVDGCVLDIDFRGCKYTFDKKSLGGEVDMLPRFLAISYSPREDGRDLQTFSAWFEYACDVEAADATETACVALLHVESGRVESLVKLRRSVVDEFTGRKSFAPDDQR